jgi:hypothetical protein
LLETTGGIDILTLERERRKFLQSEMVMDMPFVIGFPHAAK